MFRKLSLHVVSLTCFNVVADCNADANAARLDNRLYEAEALLADCLDAELGRLADYPQQQGIQQVTVDH
jgi:hypothetical protein